MRRQRSSDLPWGLRLNNSTSRKGCQFFLEGFLDALSVGYLQFVLFTEKPMRPDCSIIATGQITEFCNKSIAQCSRRFGSQRWFARICLKLAIAADSRALWSIEMTTIEPAIAAALWLAGLRCLLLRWQEIRSIDIVLTGNPDQREQRIAPRVGQCRPPSAAGWPYRQ